MKSAIQAIYKGKKTLEVSISKDIYYRNISFFYFYEDDKIKEKLIPIAKSESNNFFIYTLSVNNVIFSCEHDYFLYSDMNIQIPIDISYLATLEEFNERYKYSGKLGAIYTKKKTTFRVFSPFAREMKVKIKRKEDLYYRYYTMTRLSCGVYETSIEEDLESYIYMYEAKIFGTIYEVNDPYSFSLSSNGKYSYIVDLSKIKNIDSNIDKLTKLDSKMDYIIYECSVRDMTSKLDIEDKCTYKALTYPIKDKKRDVKLGIDYLESLGVTHIQLMPVLDFYTINEDDPLSQYNWGYDPNFFFVNEGSYSTDPNDPYKRLFELKELISSFHKRDLRVILDVVYNHVFSVSDNPLNILVPNYYFRKNPDGSLSNGSGCGNDIESKHHMARKLIMDSIIHYIKYFDVDGFRFDLMGVLDVDTINIAYQEAEKLKADIFFLGEGWDLWTNLKADEKCSMNNARKVPQVAFFNDRFRDIVKGQTNESQLSIRGYLSGDVNYLDGFKHVMLGSCKPIAFAPLFENPSQSVNYLECHDNNVLYDKLKFCLPLEGDNLIFRRIKMCIMATLFASGIPFFHQGEEIGLSKHGERNSYNKGDFINGFDYSLLKKREELYEFFKQAVILKKYVLSLAKENSVKDISTTEFINLPYGAVLIKYVIGKHVISLIFNPTYEKFTYDFNTYNKLIFSLAGNMDNLDTFCQVAIINEISFSMYIREEE